MIEMSWLFWIILAIGCLLAAVAGVLAPWLDTMNDDDWMIR